MMNDPISKALDLEPMKNEVKPKEKTEVQPIKDNKIEQDFEFARINQIQVIDKGREALDNMLDVAQMSQHPRGYEVVATLMNSITTANEKLLDLSKRKKDLEGEKNPTTINNNLFVGSTNELQKLLKKNNESD